MTVGQEVSVRSPRRRPLWVCVGVGAAGAVLAAGRLVYSGAFADWWVGGGLLAALVGVAFLHGVTLEVGADAYGVRYGSLLRRHRSMPWDDIADLRVHIQYGRHGEEYFRVGVLLRDGRTRRLPLPVSGSRDDRPDFDATLDALRALHRRHGNPESDHLAVISRRTAGRAPPGRCSCACCCSRGPGWPRGSSRSRGLRRRRGTRRSRAPPGRRPRSAARASPPGRP